MLLADDTKTYQEIDTERSKQEANRAELQRRVDSMVSWARDWKMMINPGESKICKIGYLTGIRDDYRICSVGFTQ